MRRKTLRKKKVIKNQKPLHLFSFQTLILKLDL